MVESTEKQIESFFVKETKEPKKEFFLTEAEELEAAQAFKVTHAKPEPKQRVEPAMYSAEEVKEQQKEYTKPYNAPYNAPVQREQPEQLSEGEPEHQSMEITKKQHIPNWEAGVFDVTIEGITRKQDKDFWHTDDEGNPGIAWFYYVTLKAADGRIIRKRTSDVYSDKSKLGELVMAALGKLPARFMSDDLVGKPIRILIKLAPNSQGIVWERVEQFLPNTQFQTGGPDV